MAARPAPFKQVDLTRVVKGVIAGGISVGRVEVKPDGTFIVFAHTTDSASSPNPWDTP